MTLATDISALKSRCTKIEAVNTSQAASLTALAARIAKLEAVKPFDPAALTAAVAAFDARLKALEGSTADPPPIDPPPVDPPPVDPPPVEGEPAATVQYEAGTFASPTTYANGAVVAGRGIGVTIISGHLDFGSNQTYRDMTIVGLNESAINNGVNATNTRFVRCRFRGGGTKGDTYTAAVICLGMRNSCNGVYFKDCEVECNQGTEDAGMTRCLNNISVYAKSGVIPQDITFDGCHIGVSNGVRTGSPRMGFEATINSGTTSWQNLSFINCVVEVCDAHGLDFSDDPGEGRSSGVLVEGCWLKGGGLAQRNWGPTLNFEYPLGPIVRNCTIGRGWYYALQMDTRNATGFTDAHAVITNNVFNVSLNNGVNGVNTGDDQILLLGAGNVYTGNTVT